MSKLDWIIRGGRVFTGGAEGIIHTDVGISGRRIVKIGDLSHTKAYQEIQLDGRIVSPGFIDLHSHSDLSLLEDGRGLSKIHQGVTTEVTGNCSMSPAPIRPDIQQTVKENCAYMAGEVSWGWQSFGDYLDRLTQSGTSMNVAPQVGHGTLRTVVMGLDDRPATAEEINEMCGLLSESLDEGAVGFSTGLMYPPSSYAREQELEALCEVVAEHDALYSNHMRNEGRKMLDAVEETLELARNTSVRTQISHLKAAGPPNWGDVTEAVRMIEEAQANGYRVQFDVYPYTRGSTQLRSLLPPSVTRGSTSEMLERLSSPQIRDQIRRAMEEGEDGWESFFGPGAVTPDRIRVASVETDKNHDLVGQTLEEISRERDNPPWDTLCDLLIEEKGQGLCVLDLLDSDDVDELIGHPRSIIASDGLAIPPEGRWKNTKIHPRYYGCFPRFLQQYTGENCPLSLEQALRKLTTLPAKQLGCPQRGTLAKNSHADLVIFDPDQISDRATFEAPHQLSNGIEWLFVNGDPVIARGEYTDTRPGQIHIN